MDALKYTKFISFSKDELQWDFGKSNPYFTIPSRNDRTWGSIVRVEPFPCVGQVDIELVRSEAAMVQSKFPIGTLLTWCTLPYEFEERTNAWAQSEDLYFDDLEYNNKHIKEGRIVFTARRTIIHPALVKYLVAHEYGHHVEYWVNKKMCIESNGENQNSYDHAFFKKKYAEFRGLPPETMYNAGEAYKHSVTEIIANDFRIVVCGRDPDIYPHYCTNPAEDDQLMEQLKNYWGELYESYSFRDDI